MIRRGCSIGLSAILGLAFLLTATAPADDKEPPQAAKDGKRVLKRGESRQQDQTTSAQAAEEQAPNPEEKKLRLTKFPIDQSARRPAERTLNSRVLVRDLRYPPHRSYALDRRYREDARYYRTYRHPPTAPFYPLPGVSYGYGPYGVHRWLADAYYAGRYDERYDRQHRFNRRDMRRRKQRLLDKHEQAVEAGLEQLRRGETARAIVAFTLAAKLNQGDPACRIHLAQARLAEGHYGEAALALRRALELQPKLVYVDLHLQEYYASAGVLDESTDRLAQWVNENDARGDVPFLLGFFEFQRGDFAAAHAAFERAAQDLPDDDLTHDYLEITKPTGE
jgi:tetratricopeptide (TPR) repeat protein